VHWRKKTPDKIDQGMPETSRKQHCAQTHGRTDGRTDVMKTLSLAAPSIGGGRSHKIFNITSDTSAHPG